MKLKESHIFLLLTILFICCLIVSLIYIDRFSTNPIIVRLYEKSTTPYCGKVLQYDNIILKSIVNFVPHRLEVADGYIVYLYLAGNSNTPYRIFTKGIYEFSPDDVAVDGRPIQNGVEFITIEYESNNTNKSFLSAEAQKCPPPPPPPPPPQPQQKEVIIFQHCNYQGYSVRLPEGDYNMGHLISRGMVNDDISSIIVPNGLYAELFEHANFQGKKMTFTSDQPCFVNYGFNDVVSSIKIKAISTLPPPAPLPPPPAPQQIIVTPAPNYPLGRMVEIRSTRNEYMNISEIELFDENNKPILRSEFTVEIRNQYNGWTPDKLVDGSKNTFSHTQNIKDSFFLLRLKRDRYISKIVVTNRKDCCKERIRGAILFIRNSASKAIWQYTFSNIQDVYIIQKNNMTRL